MSSNSNSYNMDSESTQSYLLSLPLEVQGMIYRLAVGEQPALRERTHHTGCPLRVTEAGVVEHPPFIWQRTMIHVGRSGPIQEYVGAYSSYNGDLNMADENAMEFDDVEDQSMRDEDTPAPDDDDEDDMTGEYTYTTATEVIGDADMTGDYTYTTATEAFGDVNMDDELSTPVSPISAMEADMTGEYTYATAAEATGDLNMTGEYTTATEAFGDVNMDDELSIPVSTMSAMEADGSVDAFSQAGENEDLDMPDVAIWVNNLSLPPPPATQYPPKRVTIGATWAPCNCGKRDGLNLLLACRSIHKIAAPIFWSTNTFSFADGVEFAACMAATSPDTRELIRDVSVMSLERRAAEVDARVVLMPEPAAPGSSIRIPSWVTPSTWTSYQASATNTGPCERTEFSWLEHAMPLFWDAAASCPNLKSLGVPASYMNHFHYRADAEGRFTAFLAGLPHLEHMDLTRLSFHTKDRYLRNSYDSSYRFWEHVACEVAWCSFVGSAERFDWGRHTSAANMLVAMRNISNTLYSTRMDKQMNSKLLISASMVDGPKTVSVGGQGSNLAETEITIYSLPRVGGPATDTVMTPRSFRMDFRTRLAVMDLCRSGSEHLWSFGPAIQSRRFAMIRRYDALWSCRAFNTFIDRYDLAYGVAIPVLYWDE